MGDEPALTSRDVLLLSVPSPSLDNATDTLPFAACGQTSRGRCIAGLNWDPTDNGEPRA